MSDALNWIVLAFFLGKKLKYLFQSILQWLVLSKKCTVKILTSEVQMSLQ